MSAILRGDHYHQLDAVETPAQQLRSLIRHEAERIRLTSCDFLSQAIAEKILDKLYIKDLVDRIQRYKDDPSTYQPMKQLGMFIVMDRVAKFDRTDEESGFTIKEGEPYLDIHVPPHPNGVNFTILFLPLSLLLPIFKFII